MATYDPGGSKNTNGGFTIPLPPGVQPPSIGSSAAAAAARAAAAATAAAKTKTSVPSRPSAPPPSRQSNTSSSYGSGYGGSSGGSSGGNSYGGGLSTGGTGSLAPIATPPPPAPPSIDEWLAGDTTYKSSMDALNKSVADYLAQSGAQRNSYLNQYTGNVNELGKARVQGVADLKDDYAARGLMTSGLYGKAYSDLQTEYDTKQKDLDTAKANFLAQLLTGQQNFQSDANIKKQTAKQSAIDRRAAQYNL